jgi:hypothetical protein
MVPMQNLGKLSIRFTFFDSHDHIFRKKARNSQKYRLAFTAFDLILEEARLAPTFEHILLTSKKQLAYPGVTRLQLVESIPGSLLQDSLSRHLHAQISSHFLRE